MEIRSYYNEFAEQLILLKKSKIIIFYFHFMSLAFNLLLEFLNRLKIFHINLTLKKNTGRNPNRLNRNLSTSFGFQNESWRGLGTSFATTSLLCMRCDRWRCPVETTSELHLSTCHGSDRHWHLRMHTKLSCCEDKLEVAKHVDFLIRRLCLLMKLLRWK